MSNNNITIVRTPSQESQELLSKYDYANLTKEEMLICSEIILSDYRDREKLQPSSQSQDKLED
jgi:hypothetical protein